MCIVRVWSFRTKTYSTSCSTKPSTLYLCACVCVSFPTLSYDDGLLRLIGAVCCLSYPPSAVAQWNSALHCFSGWRTRAHLCVCVRRASTYTHACTHPICCSTYTQPNQTNRLVILNCHQPGLSRVCGAYLVTLELSIS